MHWRPKHRRMMCLTFRGAVPPGPPLRGRADAEGVWLGGRRGCVVGRWADAEGVWLGGGRTQRADAKGGGNRHILLLTFISAASKTPIFIYLEIIYLIVFSCLYY